MGTPLPIQQANLGMADSLILMVLALVVFGPRRLPQIGRQIGKLMYEFRKASNDFKFQMEEELRTSEEADRRKREEAERQRTLALNPPAPAGDATSSQPQLESAPLATTEASYPRESTHGDFGGQGAPAVEESTPRILPPSTGETVATERPHKASAEKTLAPPETTSLAGEAAAEQSGAVSEQATHNG